MSFEKVNPSHPDKVADRIAGAIVDLAYKQTEDPKIAVEVLIGHYRAHIIVETSVPLAIEDIESIVHRIAGEDINVDYQEVPQDYHLAENQSKEIRCGDNGIFKGVPINEEEATLRDVAKNLYKKFPTDGKFIYNDENWEFIACQSNAKQDELITAIEKQFDDEDRPAIYANPLGDWTGGTSVDTGATNRKLGSDMGRAVTGGGLHGKDLSKADVSINIAAHIIAQDEQCEVDACCAIGDELVSFRIRRNEQRTDYRTMDYSDVVEMARDYINELGGFEKLAEWGLV